MKQSELSIGQKVFYMMSMNVCLWMDGKCDCPWQEVEITELSPLKNGIAICEDYVRYKRLDGDRDYLGSPELMYLTEEEAKQQIQEDIDNPEIDDKEYKNCLTNALRRMNENV